MHDQLRPACFPLNRRPRPEIPKLSASTRPNGQGSTPEATAAFVLLLAVMVFTPLFRAGATPLAALGSQLLATGLLVAALWSPQRITISRIQAVVLLLLALLPALYLIPLPSEIAGLLPGRSLYAEAAAFLPASDADTTSTLSIYPGAASASVLALVLPLGVFLGARMLTPRQLNALIGFLIAIATLQALFGLLQYGIESGGGMAPIVDGAHRLAAVGTYANRNHLAGLIEMVLPVTLALLFHALSRLKVSAYATDSVKHAAASLGSRPGHALILYASLALLLIVGVVFTRSRTGIALTILAIIVTAALFSRQIGRKSALGPAGVVIVLALAAGIGIGLAPVLNRFSVEGLEGNARWQIFGTTIRGIGALFPVGGGPGVFPFAFPAYQPLELGRAFVNRAHNDYLEWLFDFGVVGVVLAALVIVPFALQWRRVFGADWSARATYIQIGCGIGALLLGLHEFVDYNLFTPANQVVFALLLSLFLCPPEQLADNVDRGRRRKRNTPDLVPRSPSKPTSVAPPPDQIENPFLSR